MPNTEETNVRHKINYETDEIESDWATYCRVLADQDVSEPLIPCRNPSKQLSWKVEVQKGVTYNPKENPGIYARIVTLHYGCLIKGTVFAKERLLVQSGFIPVENNKNKFFCGIINGSLISLGSVEIGEPNEKEIAEFGDWKKSNPVRPIDYPLIVRGNIICNTIHIKSGVKIQGNIIAENDVIIDPGNSGFVKVGGFIYSIKGTVAIQRCSCKTIRSQSDLEIKNGVALKVPFLSSVEGKVILEKDIDVADSTICDRCTPGILGVDECSVFRDGKCTDLIKLNPSDVIKYQAGEILTRSWRTSTESNSSISESTKAFDH